MSKTYIAGLCIATVMTEAMQVTWVPNSENIEDMHEFGYFKDSNAFYNNKTAAEKKDDLWTLITEDDTMSPYLWKE